MPEPTKDIEKARSEQLFKDFLRQNNETPTDFLLSDLIESMDQSHRTRMLSILIDIRNMVKFNSSTDIGIGFKDFMGVLNEGKKGDGRLSDTLFPGLEKQDFKEAFTKMVESKFSQTYMSKKDPFMTGSVINDADSKKIKSLVKEAIGIEPDEEIVTSIATHLDDRLASTGENSYLSKWQRLEILYKSCKKLEPEVALKTAAWKKSNPRLGEALEQESKSIRAKEQRAAELRGKRQERNKTRRLNFLKRRRLQQEITDLTKTQGLDKTQNDKLQASKAKEQKKLSKHLLDEMRPMLQCGSAAGFERKGVYELSDDVVKLLKEKKDESQTPQPHTSKVAGRAAAGRAAGVKPTNDLASQIASQIDKRFSTYPDMKLMEKINEVIDLLKEQEKTGFEEKLLQILTENTSDTVMFDVERYCENIKECGGVSCYEGIKKLESIGLELESQQGLGNLVKKKSKRLDGITVINNDIEELSAAYEGKILPAAIKKSLKGAVIAELNTEKPSIQKIMKAVQEIKIGQQQKKKEEQQQVEKLRNDFQEAGVLIPFENESGKEGGNLIITPSDLKSLATGVKVKVEKLQKQQNSRGVDPSANNDLGGDNIESRQP